MRMTADELVIYRNTHGHCYFRYVSDNTFTIIAHKDNLNIKNDRLKISDYLLKL